MVKVHGGPCWYELSTSEGALAAAEAFYGTVLGWAFRDSGMQAFAYRLAADDDGGMVAGLMVTPKEAAGVPPHWLIYFGVDSADAAVGSVEAAGGRVYLAPTDIPGTGRFAVVADPQGAAFGVLQPEPMPGGGAGDAFDQQKAGHGNWNELMTTDPAGAFAFYAGLLGWGQAREMDMGEMGTYRILTHDGAEIGGMMGLGNAPVPAWLPYFGVNGVDAAMERIAGAGGRVAHGPMEVPGGAFIAVAQDPQGAWFAVVGPKERAT